MTSKDIISIRPNYCKYLKTKNLSFKEISRQDNSTNLFIIQRILMSYPIDLNGDANLGYGIFIVLQLTFSYRSKIISR